MRNPSQMAQEKGDVHELLSQIAGFGFEQVYYQRLGDYDILAISHLSIILKLSLMPANQR
ncbi:MAG: hypothetical protein HOJ58_09820 [Chloroflexi bacterium]|jgi:hypothetical protein|nr:hypothetical protein [Chloroflexota bacterium]